MHLNSAPLHSSYQFNDYQLINYIELSASDVQMVLDWRNDSKVRVWSYNPELISRQDHKKFIHNLLSRLDIGYWLIKKGDQFIGVFNLSRCNFVEKQAYLGTDVAPDLIGKGYGRMVMDCIEYIALTVLGFNTLKLEVLENNINAISLYEKCAYKPTKHAQSTVQINDRIRKIITMQKGLSHDE